MNQERELQWDDQIVKDGPEFILLPEGDYDFTVTKFERGRFQGSTKMPACNQAKIELTIHTPSNGDIKLEHSLLLHTRTEGFLSNFFGGIGQKKEGEPLRMNWNAVIGGKGRLKLKVENYTKKDGSQGQSNKVDMFYTHEELAKKGIQVHSTQPSPQQPMQQAPQYQQQQQPAYQPPQQNTQPQYQQQPFPTNNPPQQGGGFTPGQF